MKKSGRAARIQKKAGALALLLIAGAATAQTPPDAGRTLQEQVQPPPAPSDREILLGTPPSAEAAAPGGVAVTLREITFAGNQLIDSPTLTRAVGAPGGRQFAYADLLALTERITQLYRQRGYPFVRATLPPQDLSTGVLRIDILEGHYGRVQAAGDAWLERGAQPFLEVLHKGDAIESTRLERVMLLLDNQPGIRVSPFISPGQARGEGDLTVKVERKASWEGEVGYDNTGNQYTGEQRLHANIAADSPFLFGDRLALRTLLSDEMLWLGSLDYELPLGGRGLRAQVGYAHTDYQLGKQYETLNATGYARVASTKLSYPLIRSQISNLSVSTGYQHKWLEDRYDATGIVQRKNSDSLPLAVQFDHRDRFIDGGITYGALTWTVGRLHLDGNLREADAATAQTQGGYNKWNLDVARIQRLVGNLSAYGRFSGQWTTGNLDSSERLGLGGIYGVRAYPMGEGTGDRGWLAQTELRYAMGAVTPFVFYDMGHVTINASPWNDEADLSRQISGRGLGVRADHLGWYADATVAWRNQGGEATADAMHRNPRYWLILGNRF